MTITTKQKRLLVVALIIALLSGMFVPVSPAYASTETSEEELILEGGSGEVNITGDELPENAQLLFAAPAMEVDSSVQLDTQYKITYDNFFTHRFRVKVNGEWKVAYCVQPDLLAPPDGTYNPDHGTGVEYDVAKGIYYSYGYPGWTKTTKPVVKKILSQYGDKDWDLSKSDDCYALCHILLSYYYDDESANTADAFLGVDKDTRQIIRALAKQIKEDTETFPDVPRTADSCAVSFTADGQSGDGITVELDKNDWNSSKAIQTTPTIKLKGYRDNSVNLKVPEGATMYMTVDGETTKYVAGTNVEVFVGDPFYFTAPETKTGTWSSGTLKANIAEFTAYMIKVSGKQNMAFAGTDNADTTSLKIDWIDEGEGKLIKVTENPEITKNNSYYSLAEGEFKVYKEDGSLYKTLKTDAKGTAMMENVPYGTYTVKEVKAPTGHANNGVSKKVVIDSPRLVEFSFSDLAQSDVISIVLYKADSETKLVSNLGMIPQNAGSLEGAEFEIKFYGKNNNTPKALVPEDNTPLAQWKVRTDARGEAKLSEEYLVEGYNNSKFYKNSKGEIVLPLGIVTIQETKAPEGYLLNDKIHTKYITAEGTSETVTTFAQPTAYNQIKRGDFELIKVSDGTMKRLANGAFKVTALEKDGKPTKDGEYHIIVTDKNGYFSSAASWIPSTQKTNANDAAWDGKRIDDSKLDATAGLWFGPDHECSNNKGSLPYGNYRLDELRCEGNIGHKLLKGIEFNISRNGVTVDLGTLTDDHIIIETTAKDVDTDRNVAYARDNFVLKDTVEYLGLEKGLTYTLKGVLMDKATGNPVVVNGKQVTSETKFVAEGHEGTVDVEFRFDASSLKGKDVVVFETLYEDEFKIAIHQDLNDEGQTIKFKDPKLDTVALGKETGIHEMLAGDKVTVTDTVKMTGLIVGEKVTLTGSIVDKETGKPIMNSFGNPVSEKVTFTPKSETEKVTMDFTFDSKDYEGKSVVIYQTLSWNDIKVSSHKDLENADQTIVFPEIKTTAVDEETGIQNSRADSEVTITDTVSYKNLIKGHTYKLVGTLMDKETGKPIVIDGKEIVVEKKFTADNTSGSVDIQFTFDGTTLKGKEVVVFEDCFYKDKLIAVHADITDENQTIWLPEIGTTAKDSDTQIGVSKGDELATIIDTVSFKGLKPGLEYRVVGTLMDKDTGKAIQIDGKEVTAEALFTPDKSQGSIEVAFDFNAEMLRGKTVVVFENLYYEDIELAVHADITDDGQTVYFPEIGTTAKDVETKNHISMADKKVTIVDTVFYKDLRPEVTYKVTGKLMNKETGKPILVDGKEVTAEKVFTPKSENGTVDIVFKFNGEALRGETVVAFESVSYKDIEVAVHADITDEAQTVYIPEIKTSAIDSETAAGISKADKKITLIDTVSYNNLMPGVQYKVIGTLMDKDTGKPVETNGKVVTSEAVFTAESTEGTVDVVFEFNGKDIAGKTTVVFESLMFEDKEVAVHSDITDDGQTVYFPEIGTTAKDSDTNIAVSNPDEKVTIVDSVSYEGLRPGLEYKVSGILMDKATRKPFMVDGKEVTAEAVFTPKASTGKIDVTFEFSGINLEGKTVVAFESVSYNDIELAVHADITDKDQSVSFPDIKTTAKDATDGDKKVEAESKAYIVDEVKYTGLVAGEKYTVRGMLMDKDTGKAVQIDGKKATAEKTFTAKKTSGTVELVFEFDASKLDGKELVVFEKIFYGDAQIGAHEDLTDKDQTVEIVKPVPVPQTGDNSNMKVYLAVALGALLLGTCLAVEELRRKKKSKSEEDEE